MKKTLLILSGLLFLIQLTLSAQNKFVFADREYKKMRYANAIEAYEDAMKYVTPEASDYANLADSYFKVGDMQNAERVYNKYVSLPKLVKPDASVMFQYAQTLAENGKYDEAANWFEKYHEIKTLQDDSRGKDFVTAYRTSIHDFYKDSVLYDVYRLDINSPQSDFSPAFYKKGIVFASARKMENGVRRVHSWNNGAFLNLYYLDTNAVNERTYQTHIGKGTQNTYSFLTENAALHADETYLTSNDSRNVGHYAHIFKKDTTENHSFDPIPFSKQLNTKFHDGPVAFNKKQDMIVITRNNGSKRSKEGVNHVGLYVSSVSDSSSWSKAQAFPFNSKEYSVADPAFAPDNRTMYFASNMPGGFGGMDLYKTTYDSSTWSKPVNLGVKINTEGNEVFPFVDENNVIYFSSNGHPGLGGLDLFTFENDKVQHLNYPLSSKKDDFGVAVWADGRKGYLSSNRDFGGSDDDIYFFQASKNMLLSGTTFDQKTKQILKNAKLVLKDSAGVVLAETVSDSMGSYTVPVEHNSIYKLEVVKEKYHDTTASVVTKGIRSQSLKKDLYLGSKYDVALIGIVTDKQTTAPLGDVHVRIVDTKTGKDIYEGNTPDDGTFRNPVLNKRYRDTMEVDIHLAKDQYLSRTVKFIAVVSDSGEIKINQKLDLTLARVEIGTDIGKVLELNHIYYDLAKWDIREDAAKELDKVLVLMQENPGIVIELRSHTDCRSSTKSNQILSDKRAKTSAAYIISKGIDKSRIYGKGYGESKPINNCGCEGTANPLCTEEEHQLNRRTEFVIVKK